MFVRQKLGGRIISQFFVLLALAIVAIPLVLVVRESLNGQGVANYAAVLTGTPFFTFIRNSAIVATVCVVLVLVGSVSSSYLVAVLKPRGSALIALCILAGLTLPPISVIVPLFALFDTLNMLDTWWPVILTISAGSIPFGFLLCSNYIREIPSEIYEAARLDGVGTFRFLISILIPLSVPILAVVAIFSFLAGWNEYVLPLVFIQNTDLQVATQVPTYFQSEHLVDQPKVFAANVLISLPVVIAYLALQRQFRRGLSGGAVK